MTENFIKRTLSSLVLIPFIIFVIIKGSYLFQLVLIICFLFSIHEWHKMTKNSYIKLFGVIFLLFSFYSFHQIRFNIKNEYSTIFFLLIVCISTDLGGYVFGKILKGPKLTKISPNKTYSGMIGAYILSIISAIIFVKMISIQVLSSSSYSTLLLTIFLSTLSQIGDIIISYFKRKSKIKNTGNIIPGHGGILDRIDGMIFVFPVFYLLIIFGKFTQ